MKRKDRNRDLITNIGYLIDYINSDLSEVEMQIINERRKVDKDLDRVILGLREEIASQGVDNFNLFIQDSSESMLKEFIPREGLEEEKRKSADIHFESNAQNKVVLALDIGTTKVCAFVGIRNRYGKIEILGKGLEKSQGIIRGVISNIDKTVKAISEVVLQAQQGLNIEFKEVFVGIAGHHIRSLQHRAVKVRENNQDEIRRDELEGLIQTMYRLALPPGDQILHIIPQEYTVDDERGIIDPVGMSGSRLEADFQIITGQTTALNNINRCVERAGLKTKELTIKSLASAAAVLSVEEMQAGVVLVDIGGGTTDVAIFSDGVLRHSVVIPLGGNVIDLDIKACLSVTTDQAEKLKHKFGCALASNIYDNRIIAIPGLRGREPKEVSEKNLSLIIQARLEELFDYVLFEIRKSGFENKLIGGIVLTGGGALLKDINKLVEYHSGMYTRIGLPVEHLAQGYSNDFLSPAFSTCIGLLIKGLENTEITPEEYSQILAAPGYGIENPIGDQVKAAPVAPSWRQKLFRKTRAFFEDDEES